MEKLGFPALSASGAETPHYLLSIGYWASAMRWSVSGAQYILSLRAKVESRRWHDVQRLLVA